MTLTATGTLAVLAASFAAGMINAIAGGGTLVTFPTLLAVGYGAVEANATSTVGLVPGVLAGAWGYRAELAEIRPWLRRLLPSSVVGGGVGALLLLATPQHTFDRLVPFLVLGATLLFAFSRRVSALITPAAGTPHAERRTETTAALLMLLVSLYGGYFGAGLGIMTLAVLSLLPLGSLHAANGLKGLCGAAVNAVASVVFLSQGLVDPFGTALVVAGSVAGGLTGARVGRRIGAARVRGIVIAIGLIAGLLLLRASLARHG